MHLIHSTSVKGEDLDNLCWRLVKSRGFEVHGDYHSLSPATGMSIPWKLVWQSWSAALGKILFIENLRKRSIISLEWSYMCKQSGELVDHLLLHYPIAYELWAMVWILFGLLWVMPQRESLICWQHGKVPLVDIEIELFGGLCHIALCGVFGMNWIRDVLREVNGHSWD